MSSTHNPGRVAGLWYLLLIAMGPIFLIYIPDKLYVKGNAATVSNIVAHERLFRIGILAELTGGIILILLVLAFYRLFKGVDPYLAVLVVILGGVMPSVIYFVNVVNQLGALMFAKGADVVTVLDKPQREALEPCGNIRTGISKQTLWHPSARLLRRDSPHALARHQGRQAASDRRRSLIGGGWLGCAVLSRT